MDEFSETELSQTVVVTTRPAPKESTRDQQKRQPRYNVVLWDSDEHSFEYVVRMLKELFGHPTPTGFQLAETVDTAGKAVVFTTAREHAEFKCDQIHAFGKDDLIRKCRGSMHATIEPVGDDN